MMRGGKLPVASKTQAYGYHLLALGRGCGGRSRQRVARSLEKMSVIREMQNLKYSKLEEWAENSHQALSFVTTRRVGRGGSKKGGRRE